MSLNDDYVIEQEIGYFNGVPVRLLSYFLYKNGKPIKSSNNLEELENYVKKIRE